jgi:hypothetical protein
VTVFVLSLVLAAGGCVGLFLGVRGKWQGPAIGLAVQPVWAVFALSTKAYGLLITCVMYGFVNAVNLEKLWSKRAGVVPSPMHRDCLCASAGREPLGKTNAVNYYFMVNPNCPQHGTTTSVGGR